MKIYFLSAQPCALSINGCYFGLCDTFERFADLALKDENYVCFQPQGAGAIGFFLTENVRFTPPPGCEIYLLDNAIAIYARDFLPLDFTLTPLQQIQQDDVLVTLYRHGTLQLSIQSHFGFFVSTLSPSFSDATLQFSNGLIWVKTEKQLAVFNCKGEKLLQEHLLSFTLEKDELALLIPLSDALGRVADCRFHIQDGCLTRTAFSLSQTRTKSQICTPNVLRNELLAFAFFESVLIGADYRQMLCETLQAKAEELRAFLGEFSAVTLTDSPQVCGLVRKRSNDLYEVAYFTAEIENGKIIDIKG